MSEKFVLATHNAKKLRELSDILSKYGVQVVSPGDLGITVDVEETGSTFAENAMLKARAVCDAAGLPAIADDSELCVDALDGAPGVYSARFSGGGAAENRALLLKRLDGVSHRNARFACAVCFIDADGKALFGEGCTEGRILFEEIGDKGFGYDSLFFSDDLGKSFGEATEEEKNSVSHRFRALSDLRSKL